MFGDPSAPIGFTSQQYWDLVIYLIFFQGAPRRFRFFFEAGARNGVSESNTFFFERYLGWSGVLVEPRRATAQGLQLGHCRGVLGFLQTARGCHSNYAVD